MNDSIKKLVALLFINENGISEVDVLKNLETDNLGALIDDTNSELEDMGLSIVSDGKKLVMTTSSDVSSFITSFKDKAFKEDIGRGAREALSVIIYLGPVSKVDIDFIRGVNSQGILNQLYIRGFIEKDKSSDDLRSVLYRPTSDILMYLGVNNVKELKDYTGVREKLLNTLKELKESYEEE